MIDLSDGSLFRAALKKYVMLWEIESHKQLHLEIADIILTRDSSNSSVLRAATGISAPENAHNVVICR